MNRSLLLLVSKTESKFFQEIESVPSQYVNSFEKLLEILKNFTLSENEAKIFIYLGKYGTKTATEIKKALNVPRTETYRILTNLQNKKIVVASFDQPMTYTAIPAKQAIEIILEQEMERIMELKILKKDFLEIWEDVPEFKLRISEKKENKFQILRGKKQIDSKIKKMAAESKKEFLMLGSEHDFGRFYHEDIIDEVSKSKADIKILCSNFENAKEFFKGIKNKNIRPIYDEIKNQQCFVIKDGKEIIFFMNEGDKKQEALATWTDSDSMISSLSMLFELMWDNADKIIKKKNQTDLNLEDSEFRLKELQQEMLFAEALNELLKKNITSNTKKSKKIEKI